MFLSVHYVSKSIRLFKIVFPGEVLPTRDSKSNSGLKYYHRFLDSWVESEKTASFVR